MKEKKKKEKKKKKRKMELKEARDYGVKRNGEEKD